MHGTQEQFLKWYDQFSDVMFRHCVFRLSDREKAKDVTQEAFIRLWKYVAEGNEVVNARAMLYKIVNNLIIDEYRKKEHVSLDRMREEGFDPGYDVRGEMESRDEYHHVLAKMEKLPERYREVLVMRHVDGLSVKEIARLMGETENAISVRIHRAIEKFKTGSKSLID
ncbi:MAG: RNA polymerase, sigma-24 subunit, ECF subfamily [Parcubacteria group bacterium GW2011_GWA1_47_8]|nr:MAG: RNA polymerase, sigma-24 subunit, ECF subfamily [Parcubacteria group bacterium GW2011_GWA1_47_8]KKW07926.1 MAG: RNA polymerase, sigma-24 subunit, ECF subfamily [Parcubacteria group bacterium GW2011_GWA2_49_16]